jgi:hypothetical protein
MTRTKGKQPVEATARIAMTIKVRLNGGTTDDLVNRLQLALADKVFIGDVQRDDQPLRVIESECEITIDGEDD